MAYVPLAAEDLAPIGLPGNDAAYGTLIDNHDALYTDITPPIICAGSRDDSPVWVEPGNNYVDKAVWLVYGNLDGTPIRTRIRWRNNNPAGTAYAQITVDGADVAEITTTSTTYVLGSIDVTPTTPGNPSEVRLALKGPSPSISAVQAITCYYGGGTLAAGEEASGFVRAANLLDSVNEPIASEHIERLLRGPSWVGRDRRHTVVSLMKDFTPRAGRYRSSATDASQPGALIARFMMPSADKKARRYRIAALTVGDSPALRITIGSQFVVIAGGGWQSTTLEVQGGGPPIPGAVYLVTTGVADLLTLQIMREPS
jgi:hypothetical protein